MPRSTRFPPEVRERAVRMVSEHREAASRRVVGIDFMIPGGDQSGETSSGTSASSLSRSPMRFAIEPSEK